MNIKYPDPGFYGGSDPEPWCQGLIHHLIVSDLVNVRGEGTYIVHGSLEHVAHA